MRLFSQTGEQQCALNIGGGGSPIVVEFSTIVPSRNFSPDRARCLMKELPRGNVENHRDPPSGERRGENFSWTETAEKDRTDRDGRKIKGIKRRPINFRKPG